LKAVDNLTIGYGYYDKFYIAALTRHYGTRPPFRPTIDLDKSVGTGRCLF